MTLEARIKRKEALGFIEELREFAHVIDVTQLYYTPDLYRSRHGARPGNPAIDETYLLYCTQMLGVISNLAPLYTRGATGDSILRGLGGPDARHGHHHEAPGQGRGRAQDEQGNPKIGPGAGRMTFREAPSCNLCRFVVETMTATIYATVDDGPDRPVWLRLLNGTGRLLRRLGRRWPRLDPEEFLVAAQRRTGLCDWGGGHFRDGLKVLVESFDRQDTAHTFGRLFFREFCIRLLASRLRVEHDLSRYPEIKNVEICRPLFITGLPRSGTTLLHRLLSQAPGARALRFWETLEPSPPPEKATARSDPRIARARRAIRNLEGAGSRDSRRALLRGRGA